TVVIDRKSLDAVRTCSLWVVACLMTALNAQLLGTLMYLSRLVPRVLPASGLICAPLQISSVILMLFGISITIFQGIAVAPIFFWELSLGLWMAIKGFNRSAPLIVAITTEKRHEKSPLSPADLA